MIARDYTVTLNRVLDITCVRTIFQSIGTITIVGHELTSVESGLHNKGKKLWHQLHYLWVVKVRG